MAASFLRLAGYFWERSSAVAFRTATYNAIVRLLSDLRWHDVSELERVTGYPRDWLRELQHDRRFDIDAERGRLRLRLPSDSDYDALTVR